MNPILLQKYFKENSSDLQDFYKDLKTWGEEMKRKDEFLKEDTSKKPKMNTGKPKTPKLNTKTKQKAKISKTGSTDYAKWEKFDADLECEHVDDDYKDDSELTDEFEEGSRDEAIVHKEKGNAYFKAKDWDKAMECYTKAINCYAYDPIYYANRGLCYLKKNSFIAAEADCTLALRLDSTYVKALQRRASARESLGKFELAISDLQLALSHEPKNTETKAALERVRKKLSTNNTAIENSSRPISKFLASRTKPQTVKPTIGSISNNQPLDSSAGSSWPDPGCEIVNINAIKKPPHLRSKKPLVKIQVSESNSVSEQIHEVLEKPSNKPEAVKKHVVEHVKRVNFEEDLGSRDKTIKKTSAFKNNKVKAKNEIDDILNESLLPDLHQPSDIISDDLNGLGKKLIVQEIEVAEIKPKEDKNTENILITKLHNKCLKDTKNIKIEESSQEAKLEIPKTSVQFYSMWKTLKTADNKYEYLKQIDPNEIPKLFKESLDSTVFSSILEVLSDGFIVSGDDVYGFLYHLTQVPRFSALTMFMDFKDKDCLWKLIDYLREKSQKVEITNEQIQDLISKYEL
ncbi:RNA polymerase II-associated protein 3 [Euwallacea similis]|uniref:RNA polymerase II-associated protein 3 n=1 Tax=Euwallacea similis TaxID=1736056 RepID=UPI00344CD0E2